MQESRDFIRTIIDEDIRTQKHGGRVVTRFPPEPNGHLHIGHAKSICLNFGLAEEYKGTCHLRFDDTDPAKEEVKFEESIKESVRWLGFDWNSHLYNASDYFEQLYELAIQLIKKGKAYVCSMDAEQIREYRGTVTEAGKDSPYRERSVEENLDLFARMRAGEFPDGAHVLRAKIDMAAANMKMRDPALYRIRHVSHHRTGDSWCIYPLYDFTHCLSDSIEGITHSICTLEFENNRELYDWVIDTLDMPAKPKQYEFARLNINYTVMSKRKILQLVEEGHVSGWDDPRLLTLVGLRRRGYTPESIRQFCSHIGLAKANSTVDMAQLEFEIRDDLNTRAPRVLAVLNPLKVTITNYPEGQVEQLDAPYYPEDIAKEGSRALPFSRHIYIEREDFMEEAPKGYYRLSPGKEVRLRHAYIIRCDEVLRDAQGEITELLCSYDEQTPLGSNPSDGRKIKGTIHWLSQEQALAVEVRAYDRLFTVEAPGVGEYEDFLSYINPQSLTTYPRALVEPSLKDAPPESHFQFERHGYFVTDLKDHGAGQLVFNRTVTLKDSWSKKSKAPKTPQAQQEPKPKAKAKQAGKPKPIQSDTPKSPQLTPEQEKRVAHYETQLRLSSDYAILLAQHQALADYFDRALHFHPNNPSDLANWVINVIQRELKDSEEGAKVPSPEHLAQLVACVDQGEISSKIAKEVFDEMLKTQEPPQSIIESKGLKQISDPSALEPIIDEIIAKSPEVVEQIKAGRTNRMGFFVGQVMKATGGKANPQLINELLSKKLKDLS